MQAGRHTAREKFFFLLELQFVIDSRNQIDWTSAKRHAKNETKMNDGLIRYAHEKTKPGITGLFRSFYRDHYLTLELTERSIKVEAMKIQGLGESFVIQKNFDS